MKTPSEKLRELMKERGLKPVDITKATGIGSGTISKYLKNSTPSGGNLVSLAKFFGVPAEEICAPTENDNLEKFTKPGDNQSSHNDAEEGQTMIRLTQRILKLLDENDELKRQLAEKERKIKELEGKAKKGTGSG